MRFIYMNVKLQQWESRICFVYLFFKYTLILPLFLGISYLSLSSIVTDLHFYHILFLCNRESFPICLTTLIFPLLGTLTRFVRAQVSLFFWKPKTQHCVRCRCLKYLETSKFSCNETTKATEVLERGFAACDENVSNYGYFAIYTILSQN